MYTLFIDTHSSNICLALYDGKILIKSEKESIESHSIYVVPMLKELMENNNVSFDDIKNVVAVNGPGSFTGIRIGLSVAKAICYSLDKPIYLISSLTSMLVSYESDDYKMAVIPDNKGFYISVYDKDNNSVVDERYQEKIDECLTAALKWVDAFAAGDIDRVHRAILKFANPKPAPKPKKDADEVPEPKDAVKA